MMTLPPSYRLPRSATSRFTPSGFAASRAAFSLIELLVSVVVIMVLIVLISGAILRVRNRGHDAVCTANMRSMFAALNLYASEHGDWPTPFSHGSSARFLPVRWYNDGKDSYGSSASNKALDPYIDNLGATMCPSVVENALRGSTELQYYYGTSVHSPSQGQTEKTVYYDPYPSLIWCTWSNYPTLAKQYGAPHGAGKDMMNVLTWDGSVQPVHFLQWRTGAFP